MFKRVTRKELLEWITEFEADARMLAGGGDPDYMDEARKMYTERANLLRYALKQYIPPEFSIKPTK